jgi:hypothetical protein
MRGRPGIPYGEPLPNELIRTLHKMHADGFGWVRMADFADVDCVTLRRALRRQPVTRVTRERLEAFIAKHKARAA